MRDLMQGKKPSRCAAVYISVKPKVCKISMRCRLLGHLLLLFAFGQNAELFGDEVLEVSSAHGSTDGAYPVQLLGDHCGTATCSARHTSDLGFVHCSYCISYSYLYTNVQKHPSHIDSCP